MSLIKKIFLFLIPFCTLFIISCTEDSPLSDVDLDDPSLIRPVIHITKNTLSNSVLYSNETWLYDKNNNSIALKSGSVKMNDVTLSLKRGINNEPYYVVESFNNTSFKFNTMYESKITLSDDKSYTSSVTTRSIYLNTIVAPSEHNKNDNLTITWTSAANDQKLVLTLYVSSNDSSVTQNINMQNPSSGAYTIDRSYFNGIPGANKVQLTLEATNTGVINRSFRSGGSITSTITVTKNVKLL